MSMHVDMTVVPFLVVAARKPENFIDKPGGHFPSLLPEVACLHGFDRKSETRRFPGDKCY